MVFLVDDDPDDLDIVQDALSANSYKGPVMSFNDGKMFVDQLNTLETPPGANVIILDLNMPLLDGFKTLKEIRNHPTYGSTPVIILTASSNRHDEIRCFELGCNYFLTKPSKMEDYADLTGIVKKFVARS